MKLGRLVAAMLFVGLAVNLLLAIDAFTVGAFVPLAEAQAPAASASEPAKTSENSNAGAPAAYLEAETTYRNLVEELTEQRRRLQKSESDLAERERQIGVLSTELDQRARDLEKREEAVDAERKKVGKALAPSMEKLLKAYEGMEPANAAHSLHELMQRAERKTVIDILLGLKPRQSAAALDALAAEFPREAADLSQEIWKQQPR